ncbi:uncharacterized protein [Narcine bancroftii]|uniref:uncharacterized protein n=1 Tax=Narcine bancroftii TaxID=1343680 RepID=UPI0038316BC6
MERLTRPEKLDIDPQSATAFKAFKFWLLNFENFLRFIQVEEDNQRLTALLSMVSLRVYENIQDETTYTAAIKVLKGLYDQPVNRVHARLVLASRKQQPGESSRAYLQVLKALGKDCNCVDKTAAEITSDLVRDAYVAGLRSNEVRLRLLEQGVEKLEDVARIAITMEDAALKSTELSRDWTPRSDVSKVPFYPTPDGLSAAATLPRANPKCYFCGRNKHSRSQCPARKARCQKCLKNGHFAAVCRSKMAASKHSASCEAQPPLSHSNSSSPELSSNESEGSPARQRLTSRRRRTRKGQPTVATMVMACLSPAAAAAATVTPGADATAAAATATDTPGADATAAAAAATDTPGADATAAAAAATDTPGADATAAAAAATDTPGADATAAAAAATDTSGADATAAAAAATDTPGADATAAAAAATDTPGADATAAAATPAANQVLTLASIADDRQGPTTDHEQLQTPLLTIHPPQQHFREVLQPAPRALTTSSRCVTSSRKTRLSTASITLNQQCSHPLTRAMELIKVHGHYTNCLFDSGSTDSFIQPDLALHWGLDIIPTTQRISLATRSHSTGIKGYCIATLEVQGVTVTHFKLFVLPQLCAPVLLGLDFQCQFQTVSLHFGGPHAPLSVCHRHRPTPEAPEQPAPVPRGQSCGLSTLRIAPPALFANLTPGWKPVATKSRQYSYENRQFIRSEVRRLLDEGIIEPSSSPWRAQVVVVKNGEKLRMVVDYSQTINRFTLLDAYPLPRITDVVNQIAQYRIFSTIDLRSAYHQLPIRCEDRPFTAFEANGRLYQFLRVPFGVTNGVAVFQREMDRMVDQNGLTATFPYLDNITICGHDMQDHDANLDKFLQTARQLNLTYNLDKCVFRTTRLAILGCVVENGIVMPDPDRMRPLMDLPPPHTQKALKRCLGLFSYYAQWVPNYADKARPLIKTTSFPLSTEATAAFDRIKSDIAAATLHAIDESVPFQVESDASDFALAATLNQAGRPVAFFSRTLQGPESRHSSIEKEAQAIVEAVRRWRHYLAGRRFTLLTDQRAVSFMFSNTQRGKIKNDKIARWRIELSTFNYDILYRPGKLNDPPDALSRGTCASIQMDRLRKLHEALCHPGVTRFAHFVKARNLPYTIEEIRSMTRACSVCAECKPHFFRPDNSHVIKATRPFERLSVDFKGPLPSTNRNTYILTAIDEYSRFPFAVACPDTTATSVIQALHSIFTIFGYPNSIHSDRGSSFMSSELQQYLLECGIASSRTTSYNPRGNGQVERENATIWRAVTLALRSKGLPTSHWQEVLTSALHSIRSLLCTATNATPHERMFLFPRKSESGTTVPAWLTVPGPVLLRRHVRHSKNDPLVDRVTLLHANPHYAYVEFPDGREDTVSVRDLAQDAVDPANPPTPYAPGPVPQQKDQQHPNDSGHPADKTTGELSDGAVAPDEPAGDTTPATPIPAPRRSRRMVRPPDRYSP